MWALDPWTYGRFSFDGSEKFLELVPALPALRPVEQPRDTRLSQAPLRDSEEVHRVPGAQLPALERVVPAHARSNVLHRMRVPEL